MKTLNANSQNRQAVLDKMSKYVKEYAKKNRVAKYLELKKFKDSNGLIFDGLVLNKSKLFEHTSFFKNYKKEYAMCTRGERTENFYIQLQKWFGRKHLDYMTAEIVMYKLFNDDGNFTKNDLQLFNNLYKRLYIENTKNE
jgi:hypothetical protein